MGAYGVTLNDKDVMYKPLNLRPPSALPKIAVVPTFRSPVNANGKNSPLSPVSNIPPNDKVAVDGPALSICLLSPVLPIIPTLAIFGV